MLYPYLTVLYTGLDSSFPNIPLLGTAVRNVHIKIQNIWDLRWDPENAVVLEMWGCLFLSDRPSMIRCWRVPDIRVVVECIAPGNAQVMCTVFLHKVPFWMVYQSHALVAWCGPSGRMEERVSQSM